MLTCLFLVANAQRINRNVFLHYQEVDSKKFHFGFTLGFNYMDYNFCFSAEPKIRTEVANIKPGFNVGVIADYKLNKDFSIRILPGLEFGSRSITFIKENNKLKGEFESILIDLPLVLKYKASRLNNARPYFISGIGFKYDIQADKGIKPEDNIFIRTQSFDYYCQFGFGIDWYFPYFKWSTEIKFAIGLRDILNHICDEKNPEFEDYTKAIEKMNSKIVSISFHFE